MAMAQINRIDSRSESIRGLLRPPRSEARTGRCRVKQLPIP